MNAQEKTMMKVMENDLREQELPGFRPNPDDDDWYDDDWDDDDDDDDDD